jgi:hypothetical protein
MRGHIDFVDARSRWATSALRALWTPIPYGSRWCKRYRDKVIDEAAKALRRRLGAAASTHAHSALDCYQNKDSSGFYLHAGTAIELSLKARLLQHGLFAIAPSQQNWFQAAIALMTNPDSPDVQTVGGRDAVKRLLELEPNAHLGLDQLVLETIDRWNQVKHLGLAREPSPEDLLAHTASFLRVANSLLQRNPSQFWGTKHPLVEQLVAEELSAVGVRVAEKLDGARGRVQCLGPQMVADLANVVAQAIADADLWNVLWWAEYPCPVCHSPGRAYGEAIDKGEVDVDADHGEISYHWASHVVTIVESFKCDVCGLDIEGADELDAADLPRQVDNQRVDFALIAEPDH